MDAGGQRWTQVDAGGCSGQLTSWLMRGGFRQLVFQKSVFLKHPNVQFSCHVCLQVSDTSYLIAMSDEFFKGRVSPNFVILS